MKRVTAIALILMMSLQCFYKLGVVTYFQVNQDFIARVLCINKNEPAIKCHGQCFLKEKLNIGDQTESDHEPLARTQRGELPVFLVSENCYSLNVLGLLERNNSRYLITLSSTHDHAPFHPPARVS